MRILGHLLLGGFLLVLCDAQGAINAVNVGDIVAANYRAGGGKVISVNPQTGSIRRMGAFNLPTDVSISSNGFLYVSEQAGLIKRINLTNGVESIVNPNTTLSQVWGMALGADGDLFVSTGVSDRVVRINHATGAESVIAQGGQLSMPRGLDFVDPGHLIVASRSNNRIVSISLSDQSQTVLAQGANGIDQPWGVAAFNGDVYVATYDSRLLFRITGTTLTNILPAASPKLGGNPYGLATDLNGNIVIGISGGLVGPYALERRDPQGSPMPAFSAPYIAEITGIEVSRITVPAANQINTAPILSSPEDLVADEDTVIAFSAEGIDSDWPLQELTYELVGNVPVGTSISSDGVFVWHPTEVQGPSTNLFTVRVTDNGVPSMSATQTFSIVVREVNTPPAIDPVGTRQVARGEVLSLKVQATDLDLPPQKLTFSLLPGAPDGVSITPSGDLVFDTSKVSSAGVYSLGVTVSDNSEPSLSDTNFFTVSVEEANIAPEISPVPTAYVDEGTLLSIPISAFDSNGPSQTLTFSFAASVPNGAAISPTGTFSWAPPEVYGPGTNVITVRVVDSGSPPLSATNSFTVIVREINRAPILEPIPSQVVTRGDVLAFKVVARDHDLPAQGLLFSLGSNAPAGAVMSSTGDFTWAVTESFPIGSHVVTVKVEDDFYPPLGATQDVVIEVRAGLSVRYGDTFIADYGGNTVLKIDATSGVMESVGSFPGAVDIAIATNGTLYVAQQSGQIQKLDLHTGDISLLNTNSQLQELGAITLGSSGQLYVTTTWNNGVARVDPFTGAETLITQGGLISGPYGLAMMDTNHLLVSSYDRDCVVLVALTNGTQSLVAEGLNLPGSVAVSENVIFVACQGSQSIEKVSNGAVTRFASLPESPSGLGIGTNGNVIVTVNGVSQEVFTFAPTGLPLCTNSSGPLGFYAGLDVLTFSLNHPPVLQTNSIWRFPDVGGKIRKDMVLGYDPDGDGLNLVSVDAVTASGGAASVKGAWILYAPPGGFTNSDSFKFTVRDDRGAASTGTILVRTEPNEIVCQNFVTGRIEMGEIRLRFSGIPSAPYLVQYSTNQIAPVWQPLGSAVADQWGEFQAIDNLPAGQVRLYRSVTP